MTGMDKRSGNFRFDEAELARVPRAIERAEAGTQAEIFAVLAERSDNYRFVAYGFLALWIFIFSAVLALWWQWQAGSSELSARFGGLVTSAILDDWGLNNRGEGNGPGVPVSLLSVFVAGQIAAFVTGVLVIRMFPRLAVAITPQRIAHERAHANGVKQFLAHGIHNTAGRTGVLVFVSLDERYGEIFVDTTVEEHIGREYFLDQVAILIDDCAAGNVIDGYVGVIGRMGEKLAETFPVKAEDRNELENRFVIL
jgi:putative membrane protein